MTYASWKRLKNYQLIQEIVFKVVEFMLVCCALMNARLIMYLIYVCDYGPFIAFDTIVWVTGKASSLKSVNLMRMFSTYFTSSCGCCVQMCISFDTDAYHSMAQCLANLGLILTGSSMSHSPCAGCGVHTHTICGDSILPFVRQC